MVEEARRLVEGVKHGDVAAFETLYDTYHRLVYGIAHRVLHSETAAEDVTQHVFLKVWTAPDSFRGGNFAAWIARVARNRAIDVLRQIPGYAVLPLDLPGEGYVEEAVVEKLEATRAKALLQLLPPEQRTAIELAYFGGLTYREIAERSGTPLGTIKTRIRTGLGALRAGLHEQVAS